MLKTVLSEQFIITHKVSDLLKIDKQTLITNNIRNYVLEKRLSDEKWYSDYHYVDLQDHQHLAWIHDYIRDHYKAQYNKTPISINTAGIMQKEGEGINTHNHTWEYDYEKTPEISCRYCVAMGEKTTYITFEYHGGRVRHGRWKIPMAPRKLIIFNSEIPHYLTNNENKDPTINLSFQYQLL